MADLHKAEAAAREALADTEAPFRYARHRKALIDLLAALDAARGEAVTFQKAAGLENTPTDFTLPFRQAVEGSGDLANDWKDKPHRLIFDLCRYIERNDAAPPAALAVPAWTEAQLREEAKARGWHVREGRSVPTPDGEWRHPFEVTIPSRDLCAMLAQQPAAAVPEGYALVPVEPTEAMLDAGWLAGSTSRVWAAMLAAAERKGES